MKNLVVSLLLMSIFCIGCGEDSTPTKANDFGSLSSILIVPEYPSVANNTTSQMRAMGIYYDEPDQNITDSVVWASDNEDVATITSNGLVSAHSVGQFTITATLDSQQGELDYRVNNAAITFIDIIPSVTDIPNGLSQQFIAYGTFADVTEQFAQDITDSVEWSTLDPDIVMIDQSGLATAIGTGTADIEALFDGFIGSAVLTVSDP